jgi:uncharacterized protein YdcH (DUF465 family)
MTEHVYRKYPGRAERIQELKNRDTQFGEICDDYEEMCTWLAAQNRRLEPHSEEITQAKEIIRDLEDEIKKALEKSGHWP